MGVHEDKAAIRAEMKAARSRLTITDFRRLSGAIADRCRSLREWREAQRVHIYVSTLNNEADTLGLIFDLLDSGKTVVVPRCEDSRCLASVRIDSFDDLKRGRFGTMEPLPDPSRTIPPGGLDIVIVPLLAFDRRGGRLGFGGGFYDWLIGQVRCPVVGLAYSFQEVPAVPLEPHDCPISIILTETETIRVAHGD